jgi:hypothetical protein
MATYFLSIFPGRCLVGTWLYANHIDTQILLLYKYTLR